MLKIYFACSIRGGRGDAPVYAEMVEHINTQAIVLSEIFADQKLTPQGSAGESSDIYKKDMGWVREADAIIAEVTNPSLGVGYEIAKAEEWGKPILALFRDTGERKLSAMIDGSQHVQVFTYETSDQAKAAVDAFLKSIS